MKFFIWCNFFDFDIKKFISFLESVRPFSQSQRALQIRYIIFTTWLQKW